MFLKLVKLPTPKWRQCLFPSKNVDIFVSDFEFSEYHGLALEAASERLDLKDLLALNCLAKDLVSFDLDHNRSRFYNISSGDHEFIKPDQLPLLLMELYPSHILNTVPLT